MDSAKSGQVVWDSLEAEISTRLRKVLSMRKASVVIQNSNYARSLSLSISTSVEVLIRNAAAWAGEVARPEVDPRSDCEIYTEKCEARFD